MGNSTSSANNQNTPNQNIQQRVASPASARTSSPSRGGSPAPSSHRVHRSLRTKKKSLELPDLASLTLTPANSSPASASASPHSQYRRPQASSPIPIPASARPPPPRGFQPQNNLPSAAHIAYNHRHRSYLSSAYPSTHSFDHGGSPPRHQEPIPEHDHEPVRGKRAPKPKETVHSTLPIVVIKGEDEPKSDDVPSTIMIKWRGGGRNVILARAGDDNWKGRQQMDYE